MGKLLVGWRHRGPLWLGGVKRDGLPSRRRSQAKQKMRRVNGDSICHKCVGPMSQPEIVNGTSYSSVLERKNQLGFSLGFQRGL